MKTNYLEIAGKELFVVTNEHHVIRIQDRVLPLLTFF